ncbi:CPBP family intramembrane glutamic endopeptidase [Sandaracinus amylolyticus]|uniref:CPBP family intramembrane glutamic endopeptidase n=1 Tax=Sandaracinus amylolyticus TaxID=927083 RepID=UPI001F17E3CD|nr:type II CAAX endopeptidase family protein [Sandaracinus amylolyticus]UJR78794.1 Hypothetical protein I5071_8270 [Sandaracinus amylolyticus]
MDSPSPRDRALAIASLIAFGAQAVLAPTDLALVPVVASLVIALGAMRTAPATRAITSLVAVLAVVSWTGILWQPAMAIALGAFALLARSLPRLAPGPTWRARGEVPWLATLVVGGVTPIALVLWLVVMQPDLGDVLRTYVPDETPLALMIAGGVVFAIVNAALEELIWRGVLQDRLEALVGPVAAIVLQALSFGVAHAHGVPRGVVGVVLAGTWAVMLGALRRHARGLVAPVIAHVIADATIATIVLVLATD